MNHDAKEIRSELSFREAMLADLPEVLVLNNHLHPGECIPEMNSRIRTIWERIVSDPRLFYFVAEQNGVIVGSSTLDIVPNLTRNARPYAVLQNVVTRKDHRGRGIGRKLNEHALAFAWAQNCYQVLVQTGRPEVTAFYEKLGFRRDKIGLLAKPEWFGT